ncbi:MAG: aldo/keto reductase [Planctomycetota bacterium]|nr:MAG: aldo/keto reductase [Planctomycetota bacterium]
MEYRSLGRTGLKVSAVSYGSWLTFGRMSQSTVQTMVDTALDQGINFLDTADIYDKGLAEALLGKALAGKNRQHLVIATKAYWAMSEDPNDRGLSRKHLFESCEASLRRLGTDYLDLYQCHRYDTETPLEETVRAMGDLIAQGKILYWGTSMWSAEQLREACRIADALQVPRPASEQPRYNLLHREIEQEVLPTCEQLGIGLIVWSPLGQGLLTGKYKRHQEPPEGSRGQDREGIGRFLADDLHEDRAFDLIEGLESLAESEGHSMVELALAWCLRQKALSSVIVGATDPSQLANNVRAVQLPWQSAWDARLEQSWSST